MTIAVKKLKPKKCRVKSCAKSFQPNNSLQVVCGVKCAINLSNQKEAEKTKRKHAAGKKAFYAKDKSTQEKLAQQAFNAFIRERDAREPCISCQRHHAGQYHAGHYLSRGAHPALRFDENNCHKQCAPCNNHLSGNIASYRINLSKKIGSAALESLEGPHEPIKLTVEDLTAVKVKYKRMTKELMEKAA